MLLPVRVLKVQVCEQYKVTVPKRVLVRAHVQGLRLVLCCRPVLVRVLVMVHVLVQYPVLVLVQL